MRNLLKVTKNTSQGIIFVIISCQRVLPKLLKINKGKPTVFGHIFVHIFALYVGVGVPKPFPIVEDETFMQSSGIRDSACRYFVWEPWLGLNRA